GAVSGGVGGTGSSSNGIGSSNGRRWRQQQPAVDFGRSVRWESEQPTTQQSLQRQRDEFWETAAVYEGRSEIWQALRLACESDDQQLAQTIVESVGVTVPTGRVTDGAYDERGACYVIPQYCLSAPTNLVAAGERASIRSTDRLSAVVSNKASGSQAAAERGSMDSTQSVDIHTAVFHSPHHQPPPSTSAGRTTAGAPALLYSPASVGSSDAGSMASLHSGDADLRGVRIRLSSGADTELRLAPDASVAQIEALLRAGGHIPDSVPRVRFFHLGRLLAPQLVLTRDIRLARPAVIQAMYSTP
ncbi:hypothetical protein LPJ61_001247, partial [Coemansia biformis]